MASTPTDRTARRRQRTERQLAAAAVDDLLALFYDPLADEAAAQIADFLAQLALRFEETHFASLCRHHHSLVPCRDREIDPRQLELFRLDPPF